MSSAIVERVRALLEDTPPFNLLTDDEQQTVLKHVSIQYFAAGEVVLEQGSTQHRGLYLVESGLVRLMDVDQQQLVDKCGEGDTFGSFNLLKGGGLIYEAKAVEPTVCVLLAGKAFQQLYEANEAFATHFDSDVRQYLRRLGTPQDVTGGRLLFNHRLDQFTYRRPTTCPPETTAQQAATLMRRDGVDALLVMHKGELAGLLTDSDLRDRLVARGRSADTPVRQLMSSPVRTISADATLFDAMMTLLETQVHRLAILHPTDDGPPQVLGLITDRDLAHYRGQDPVATVRYLEGAPSVAELTDIRATMNEQLLRLYRQGVSPELLNRIMSGLYDRVAIRALELAEAALRAESPKLRVDLPWVWLRLGSSGRREIALGSGQHNALLYANPEDDEEAERAEVWFNLLAERVNTIQERAGFRPSNVVARNARWRKSLRDWKKTYREWILQSDKNALERIPYFFDLRGLYGDTSLVEALKQDMEDALNVQEFDERRHYLPLMAQNALENRPPLSFFRRFQVARTGEHRHTFDIRQRGIMPVVDAARVLALDVRYLDSANTFDRLRHVAQVVPDLTEVVGNAVEAYRFLVDFRLEHQLRAIEAGEHPDNHIDPSLLTNVQRHLLRTVFQSVETLQDAVTARYQARR